MKLLVDIGNTYIVLAEYTNKLESSYRLRVNKDMTSDEYAIYLNSMLTNEYEGVIISSITPSITNTIKEYFESKGLAVIVVGPGVKTGVSLVVNNPREVGTDIICNLATLTKEEHVIVCDFGTCTSISLMDKGRLQGVNITSGVTANLSSLRDNAELLHIVDLPAVSKSLGTDTESAIQIGVIKGQALMADGFINELRKENTKVVLTGGYAEIINQTLNNKYEVNPYLLIEGLNKIYSKNNK